MVNGNGRGFGGFDGGFGLRERLSGRRRGGAVSTLVRIAREVLERRRSVQGALSEVRQAAVLDALADEDFRQLDAIVAEHAHREREFAVILARLVHAVARAKGFDRQIVDAALRLDTLLPGDDPSRERDKLLRDAYGIAQRDGYVRGGRVALGRLGHRALEAGDSDRARALLEQQLALGEETTDTAAEVDSALILGDLLRREADRAGAQALFRRAGRTAQRLDHPRGIAEALVRQIELLAPDTDLETLAALQRQAFDAAQRTVDLGLQSRIVLSLADTLGQNGKRAEAVAQLEHGLEIARQIGDLALEGRCLAALAEAERALGRLPSAADHEHALVELEDRLGNRAATAEWAARLGTSRLALNQPHEAAEAFGRALPLAIAVGDVRLEQRALGGLGVAYTLVNRPADALDHLMRALDLARRTGDLGHQAQWLGSIGQALWTFDQPDDAIRALTEAVAVARRVDDTELQASMLALLGQIHAAKGQAPRARECYGRALDLNRRLGQTGEQVHLLAALAALAVETGQIGNAIALGEQALRLATASGDRLAAARLHVRLGGLAQRRHDPVAALEHLRRALALAEGLDHPALLGQVLQHLAATEHAAGAPTAAETYRRALTVAHEVDDAPGEALMRLNLGTLLSTDGHRDEGLRQLHRAAEIGAALGPGAAHLVRRAEAAISAATAVTGWAGPPMPTAPELHDDALSGHHCVVEDDNVRTSDGWIAGEATLPPS